MRKMDFFYFLNAKIGHQNIKGFYYEQIPINSLSIKRCSSKDHDNQTFTDFDEVQFFITCTKLLCSYNINWNFQYLNSNNYFRLNLHKNLLTFWDSEELSFNYNMWEDKIPGKTTLYKEKKKLKYFSVKIGEVNGGVSGLRILIESSRQKPLINN
uniref:Uncharacterized protein n=1 Tax=Clastoptera arizonana TaxID=38151 RepID=A0A1B6DWN2_9HEMI